MRTLWNRVTLMDFASDEDNGHTKPMHWTAVAGLAVLAWAVWTVAEWIVQN